MESEERERKSEILMKKLKNLPSILTVIHELSID